LIAANSAGKLIGKKSFKDSEQLPVINYLGGSEIRIISARRAIPQERKRYANG
jgi:uncharacterized DUF497 family protein